MTNFTCARRTSLAIHVLLLVVAVGLLVWFVLETVLNPRFPSPSLSVEADANRTNDTVDDWAVKMVAGLTMDATMIVAHTIGIVALCLYDHFCMIVLSNLSLVLTVLLILAEMAWIAVILFLPGSSLSDTHHLLHNFTEYEYWYNQSVPVEFGCPGGGDVVMVPHEFSLTCTQVMLVVLSAVLLLHVTLLLASTVAFPRYSQYYYMYNYHKDDKRKIRVALARNDY